MRVNVAGTIEMLNLGTECKKLESFVYVSTAFSNCPRDNIEEKFYDPPFDSEALIKICDTLPEDILGKITPE